MGRENRETIRRYEVWDLDEVDDEDVEDESSWEDEFDEGE